MKLAVSSRGQTLDSQMDPRFGRCAYFLIYDTDNNTFEAFENESVMLGGGAGIQSAEFVASKGAKAVLTGHCGPNAANTLAAAGVKLYVGHSGTVKECIDKFNSNELESTQTADVPSHFGMGQGDISSQQPAGSGQIGQSMNRGMGMGGGRKMGRGMGGGRGMGRGMGGGRGMGQGMGMGFDRTIPSDRGMPVDNLPEKIGLEPISKDQELNLLRDQTKELTKKLEEIQARISKIEGNNE